MDHVPVKILQRVRWALVAYNGVLVVAYFLATLLFKNIDAAAGFTIIIAGTALLQVIYEICDSTILFKENYVAKTWLSLAFALIMTFIAVQATGSGYYPICWCAYYLWSYAQYPTNIVGSVGAQPQFAKQCNCGDP